MMDMAKRVAMALQEVAYKLAIERDGLAAVRLTDEEALRLARSCIMVMREPTKPMTEAVGDLVYSYYGGEEPLALYVWQGMIDEALKATADPQVIINDSGAITSVTFTNRGPR